MTSATEFLSVIGDQFSRVALTVMVFDRTDSAALTGLTYGLTYLPTMAGALLLSTVADRRPRREVIIAINAVRAVGVAAMTVPGIPLAALCALVAASSFLNGPYKATHLAFVRDIVDAKQYTAAMALRQSVNQAGQLAGFAAGGIIASTVSPRVCLAVDAVTFALSAILIRSFVGFRPASATPAQRRSLVGGLRVVWSGRGQRAIFASTLSGLFLMAPDGLATPLVHEIGANPAWVGFLLAASAACSFLGLGLLARFLPEHRRTLVFPIACLAAGAPLPLVLLGGGPYPALIVFGLSGTLWAIQVVLSVSFLGEMLPDAQRAQGMGVAASMNLTAQGIGAALAGLVAQVTGARAAIALAGVAAVLFALWPSTLWIRREAGSPASQAGRGSGEPGESEDASLRVTQTGRVLRPAEELARRSPLARHAPDAPST
ncbi:MFS transporter [Streptomyces mirabilis]|uniref:MFS transporter n=1 Tax=Streptomyces mirabilis TaxID=68239 RepID=UPI0029308A44|nr:MFS transporter [Streptomyces mirabilis]